MEATKVSAAYSAIVLPRMKKLYESGSIAFLQYEEAKKTANLDKINVEKQQKNLASLQKNERNRRRNSTSCAQARGPKKLTLPAHFV